MLSVGEPQLGSQCAANATRGDSAVVHSAAINSAVRSAAPDRNCLHARSMYDDAWTRVACKRTSLAVAVKSADDTSHSKHIAYRCSCRSKRYSANTLRFVHHVAAASVGAQRAPNWRQRARRHRAGTAHRVDPEPPPLNFIGLPRARLPGELPFACCSHADTPAKYVDRLDTRASGKRLRSVLRLSGQGAGGAFFCSASVVL